MFYSQIGSKHLHLLLWLSGLQKQTFLRWKHCDLFCVVILPVCCRLQTLQSHTNLDMKM